MQPPPVFKGSNGSFGLPSLGLKDCVLKVFGYHPAKFNGLSGEPWQTPVDCGTRMHPTENDVHLICFILPPLVGPPFEKRRAQSGDQVLLG